MTTNPSTTSNSSSSGHARPHLDESILACSMLVKSWIDQAIEEERGLIDQATQSFEEMHLLTRLQKRIGKFLGLHGQESESKTITTEAKATASHADSTVTPNTSSGNAAGPSSASSPPTSGAQGAQSSSATVPNSLKFMPTLDAIHAWNEHFDIDIFLRPEYDVEVPAVPFVNSILTLFQRPKRAVLPPADVDNIFYYIRRLFARLRLAPESIITMLVYLERLQTVTPARLTERTWIPLVTASLVAASKVWDDYNIFNVELAEALPFFGLEQLALLERRFTVGLQYALGVTTSEYSKQYYAIRDMVTNNNARLQQLQERVREYELRRKRGGHTAGSTSGLASMAGPGTQSQPALTGRNSSGSGTSGYQPPGCV